MSNAKLLKFFFILVGVLTIETACLNYFWLDAVQGGEEAAAAVEETAVEAERAPALPEPTLSPEERKQKIDGILGEDAPAFALYLFRPAKEEEAFLYQSRPMAPASMIKVFILAAAMQDVKDGRLALDQAVVLRQKDMVDGAGVLTGEAEGTKLPLQKVMELMITESDNTAANILIDLVGMVRINEYLQRNGYYGTVLAHKMMIANRGRKNFSSAEDLGNLFTRLYRHTCVGGAYDELMIYFLANQKDRECFPAAVPTWMIAHKTGEVNRVYDDGGIFYGEEGDFILVVLSENCSSRSEAIEKMKIIAGQAAQGDI